MKNLIFIIFVGLSSSTIANAASFNCEHAQTKSEHAICEHRSLNDADVKMATTYTIIRKLVPMGTRGVIQDQQVKWLQLRNQCQGQSTLFNRCVSDASAKTRDLYESSLSTRPILKKIKFAY